MHLRLLYFRFTHHFAGAIKVGNRVLGVLTFISAIAALVSLVVLIGFDHSRSDLQLLARVIRACQWIFIFNVVFGVTLRLRATLRNNKPIKWVADVAILITLLPLIYPHPAHPWFPWLEHLLYSHKFQYPIIGSYALIELCFTAMRIIGRRTNPSLLLTGSFLLFICLGSFVLMLPKCTQVPISYVDSLFLATSGVCITGLTPVDIPTTLTPLGLGVLAILVQIGGLGVLTFTSLFALFFSGSGTMYNQLLLKDLMYSKSMNSLGPTLLYVLGFSVTVELLGAIAVYFTIPETLGLDTTEKLIFAGFHSLSSFCNAGFSCLDQGMANPALMTPAQGLYSVTSLLIFAGAIGFPILVNFKDILVQRLRKLWGRIHHRRVTIPVKLYDLNTKIVLATTLGILVAGSVLFYILESENTLAGMTPWQKAVQSVFNSLIPRSAGFQSVNPADFLPLTLMLVVIQMWIGGSSQSLAGGIKVNAVAAIFLNVRSILTGTRYPRAFDRTVAIGSTRRANAVLALAIISFLILSALLIAFEPHLPLKSLLFEATSALFTVGSSLGITADLSISSKIALCMAMLVGRVGIISLLAVVMEARRDTSIHLPQENIIIS